MNKKEDNMFGIESIKFNMIDLFDFKPVVDQSTGFLTDESIKMIESKLSGYKVDPESKVLLGELKMTK